MLLNRLELEFDLDIKDHSRTPKYRQLILEINSKIERGILPFGSKLPSINTLSEGHLLSRNTVEKAYILLKEDGVIEAVKGKGYFVKNTQPLSRLKVMLLLNSINDYNRYIYETLTEELLNTAEIDLHIYHGQFNQFTKLIEENSTEYHYYLVLPCFNEEFNNQLKDTLSHIPKERLILLNRKIDNFDHFLGLIYQDFKMDFYNIMVDNLELAKKYSKFIMILPNDPVEPFPSGILNGFRRFCTFNGFDFDVVKGVGPQLKLNKGEAAITVSDKDLIGMLKMVNLSSLKLGIDFGIISYNDSPLKEMMGNGISTITTDFEEMGKKAASMIKLNHGEEVKNQFLFIRRASF